MGRVAVDFGVGQGAKCKVDIRSDLGQASNAGQRQNQRNRRRREADLSYELGGHFSLKAKARTSQGQLRGLMLWQALHRKPCSAVAVQAHYRAAVEQMQDDRRRSEHVGLFCHVR